MTFYEVEIYSANLAGYASDMKVLITAIASVEKHFESGLVVNAGWCSACKTKPYKTGSGSPVYHVFMAREIPILEIIQSGNFSWRKKKGMGRANPTEFLASEIAQGRESWYQLELSED